MAPLFIGAITTYIGHLDPSIRRCGMLVAEDIAALLEKKLNFGGWDGTGEGQDWAAELQKLVNVRDVDVDLHSAPPEAEEPSQPEETTHTVASKRTEVVE